MTNHDHSESLADEALLQNVCTGCSACFAFLFHRYFRQVFSIAVKILRDRSEAEDVLQEVFLAIFLQRERFDRSRGSVKTWILQYAYSKSLGRHRYLRMRHFYNQQEILETREMRANWLPEALYMRHTEWARHVETGIAALSPKQRRVIELVHFEGYTLQESSEIERETLANTRNHYYRGLKALRAFLNAPADLRKMKASVVPKQNEAYRFGS